MNVHLDDATFALARLLAAERHCTIDELLRELIRAGRPAAAQPSKLIGFLADEPELVDRILDDVYRTRETQSLRSLPDGADPT